MCHTTSSPWYRETVFTVTVRYLDGVTEAASLDHMHKGKGFKDLAPFLKYDVFLPDFLHSFEVCDADQNCIESGLADNQDKLLAQRQVE